MNIKYPLNAQTRLEMYNSGVVMIEANMGTLTFKLLGLRFTSTKARCKSYHFNQPSWGGHLSKGLVYKLTAILTGTVHIMSGP